MPDLGWVGFDPANGICPTDAYVRVAVGLDYLGAAPVRGAAPAAATETMDVKLRVSHAALPVAVLRHRRRAAPAADVRDLRR